MKVNLSLPDNLVLALDKYCDKHDFMRSELISLWIRRIVCKFEDRTEVVRKIEEMRENSEPEEADVIRDVLSSVPETTLEVKEKKNEAKVREYKRENFERPLVCKKHGGQLIGGRYVCCG